MNPEDIKIGERVSLHGYISNMTNKHFFITFHTGFNQYTKVKFEIPALELYPITPENGIENPESTPKYDPRRKFRKGDKVRFKEYLGRKSLAHCDEIITLEVDEIHGQCFWLEMKPDGDIVQRNAYFCFLELVTPVEEFKPYSVKLRKELTADDTYPYCAVVDHDGNEAARFYSELYEAGKARAAAEAECDRLNAEYRKEQK